MSVHYRGLAPMHNFHIDEDVKMKKFHILKNRDSVKIKLLGLDINDKTIGFSSKQIHDWVRNPLFLYDAENVSNWGDSYSHFHKTLEMFYNVYILFKPNIFTPLFIGVSWFWPYKPATGTSTGNQNYMIYDDNRNELFKEELLKIDNVFEKINPLLLKQGDNEILNRAVLANYWLYKARGKIMPYDRMIFLNAALEALVSNSKTAIMNKISTRAGLLIGETNKKQDLICSEIKKIYEQRSKLVHGSNITLRNYDTWHIQEIVRVLILKITSLHKQYSSANELFHDIDVSSTDYKLQKDILHKSDSMFPECAKFNSPEINT